MYEVEEFPKLRWWPRLLLLAGAVAMAAVVLGSVLGPPGAAKTKRLPRADAPTCSASQTADCVGGMAAVLPAASAPP